MKKSGVTLAIILLIILSILLYKYTVDFNIDNVNQFTIGKDGEVSIISKDDRTIESLITKLESLKQYKRKKNVENQTIYTLNLQMKYGTDKKFELLLDYNFDYLYITDLANETTYVIDDGVVETIYMLDPFNNFYKYAKKENHVLFYNHVEFNTEENQKWLYMKGDNQWYENEDAKYKYDKTNLIVTNDKDLLSLLYTSDPSKTIIVVKRDNDVIYDYLYEGEILIPKENGLYEYEITTEWTNRLFKGNHVSKFSLEVDYPVEYTISSEEIEQGEFITIIAKNVGEKVPYIKSELSDSLIFSKKKDYYISVIPTTYYTKLGIYGIEYGIEGKQIHNTEIVVNEREFSIQYLTVSKSTVAATQTTEGYDQYREFYKKALLKDVYKSDKEMNFILPVRGRLSTEFGQQRYVNNKPISYNHAGLDIAIQEGTEIKATFDGEVVLAKELIVTGNSIVISHGDGIFSTYFHLNEIFIEEGEVIKTGDIIGTVGTTGFSTGPHLHFSISFYQMNLEPGYFIYDKKVTYENYEELFETD